MQIHSSNVVNPQRTGTALAHMPAIDGLRGIAILLVLFHHFTPAVSGTWFTKKLLTGAHTGWVGVDLFFVLSGFLITTILLRTKNTPDYFLNFYARRTLRIFPIYYLTLAVVLIGLPVLLTLPYVGTAITTLFGRLVSDLPTMINGQSWLWLYGSNVKIAVAGERWGAVNHFWSLAVEEHFYLVWPIVVYFCSREKLKQVCLILILSAPILRAMLMLAGFDSVVPYVLTMTRVDSMAVGGLMAALLAEKNGLLKWRPRITLAAIVSMVGLAAIAGYHRRLDRDDFVTTFVGYSFLAMVSAWLVLECGQIKAGTRACKIIANPVLASLGKYSYGLYVTHMFFAKTFEMMLPWTTLHRMFGSYGAAIMIHAVLSIAMSWCIAWVCFHAFEKHFLKLKSLFDYRRPVTHTIPSGRPSNAMAMVFRQVQAARPMRQAA
ncbi:MAG TPA: acyltransferase [Tepidisphaeraceae bacterium]|jgi:peptidoglycan/LPS O-acetylase OafA/YrhL